MELTNPEIININLLPKHLQDQARFLFLYLGRKYHELTFFKIPKPHGIRDGRNRIWRNCDRLEHYTLRTGFIVYYDIDQNYEWAEEIPINFPSPIFFLTNLTLTDVTQEKLEKESRFIILLIMEARKKESLKYIRPLNENHNLINEGFYLQGRNSWNYHSKINGKSVNIHVKNLYYGNFFLMWYWQEGKLYSSVIQAIPNDADHEDFRAIYEELAQRELKEFRSKIPKENELALRLANLIDPVTFINSVIEQKIRYNLSESFQLLTNLMQNDQMNSILSFDKVNEYMKREIKSIIMDDIIYQIN